MEAERIKATRKLLMDRGIPIREAVRERDRDMGYQVGMLLDEIARTLNVSEPGWFTGPLPPAPDHETPK